MIDFYKILQAHSQRYPLMKPCDAVKLIYQASFGPGHMISDEDSVYKRILTEYEQCRHDGIHMYTEALGETSRLYLNCQYTEDELQIVSKMFCASAAYFDKCYESADETNKAEFEAHIEILEKMCLGGMFPFTPTELDSYLEFYRTAGCPAVRHSDTYREAYSPSYRVIDSRYVRLIPCILRISAEISTGKRVILAIDGRCASGKTTAAKLISDIFDAETVHMDDFFLPPELRSEKRLSEIGGNLHRERFSLEVLPHLRNEDGFSYRKFDCSNFKYSQSSIEIKPAQIIICEGSYALHPSFGKYYDVSVFSDIQPKKQLQRIRERNGEYMLSRFESEWIPMEERYFDSFRIKEKCDLVI